MKNLRFLSMAIALVFLLGGVSSCKKKKDDPQPEPVVKNNFIGTWQYVEMATPTKSSDPTLKSTTTSFTFTKEEKYTYKQFETYSDNSTKDKDTKTGTYTYTETSITFDGKTGKLNGNKLTIDGNEYTKQ